MRHVVIGLPAVRAFPWKVRPLGFAKLPFGFAIRGPWLAAGLDSLCCSASAIAVVVEPAGTPKPNVTEDTVEPVVRRPLGPPTAALRWLLNWQGSRGRVNRRLLRTGDSGVEARGEAFAPQWRRKPLIHLTTPECIDLETVRMVMSCAA